MQSYPRAHALALCLALVVSQRSHAALSLGTWGADPIAQHPSCVTLGKSPNLSDSLVCVLRISDLPHSPGRCKQCVSSCSGYITNRSPNTVAICCCYCDGLCFQKSVPPKM